MAPRALRDAFWWTSLADPEDAILDALTYDQGSDTLDFPVAHVTQNGSPLAGGSSFAHLTEDADNSVEVLDWPLVIGDPAAPLFRLDTEDGSLHWGDGSTPSHVALQYLFGDLVLAGDAYFWVTPDNSQNSGVYLNPAGQLHVVAPGGRNISLNAEDAGGLVFNLSVPGGSVRLHSEAGPTLDLQADADGDLTVNGTKVQLQA